MKNQIVSLLIFASLLAIIPMLAIKPSISSPDNAALPAEATSSDTQDSNDNPAIASAQTDVPEEAVSKESNEPSTTKTLEESGVFTLLDESTGKKLKVTSRDYVRGALAAEMPPTFHPEAMKAQAVAAHTYALCVQRMNVDTEAEYDFSCNVKEWKTYVTEEEFRKRYGTLADAYWSTICAAADAVSNYVLLYDAHPIVAAYHSMCSGTTEDGANVWSGSAPYLRPVESRGDTLAPDFEVQTTRSVQEVRNALEAAFAGISLTDDPSDWITLGERSAGGYVLEATVGGRTVHGKELRAALNLRSTALEMQPGTDSFTFTTRGYGHGVGLSQYGADFYARQGMEFWEILSHYYTDVELGMTIPSST